jgi:hypothetical protein
MKMVLGLFKDRNNPNVKIEEHNHGEFFRHFSWKSTNVQNTASVRHSYRKEKLSPNGWHECDMIEHATAQPLLSAAAQQISRGICHTSKCTSNELGYAMLLVVFLWV